jgi:hypothetical protein
MPYLVRKSAQGMAHGKLVIEPPVVDATPSCRTCALARGPMGHEVSKPVWR